MTDDITYGTQAEAIEVAFYQLEVGAFVMLCPHAYPCPYDVEGEDCQNCRPVEKKAGDTLAEFLKRCNRLS